MLLEYNEFNQNKFIVICNIDVNKLLKISGKKNIQEAIKNELSWIDSIDLLSIDKKNNFYQIKIKVNKSIILDTDSHDKLEGINYEFQWLNQSGIYIKNVLKDD